MESTITLRERRILLGGRPRILLSGEIHYFRLERADWADRVRKLKAAGGGMVASYIPWLCHEEVEGEVDLTGATLPRLDLGAFIDLCRDEGLYFFARPGSFVMAELKNEGLPFWIYDKPGVVPVSWDAKRVSGKAVDYLAPAFLEAARRWYRAVMAVLEPRRVSRGGPVAALQLDNEVGMIAWVTNEPDLSDGTLEDFRTWLRARYPAPALAARYAFAEADAAAFRDAVRSPTDNWAAALMQDLGRYMRARFARYVATLRSWAEEGGVRDVPFVVNVHGTGGLRAHTFPVGLSQLYESYTQAPGYLSGSDIYLGNLDMNNVQDLYLINAFQHALHRPEQPLSSVEFECGDGNYGSNLGGRYDPSAADLKTRLCVAQGARLINYYLFAGGRNYRLRRPPGDGNDRIAFTGERHGFAAPLSPEGEPGYTFPRLAEVLHAVGALESRLADMEEEHDGACFAFLPDYYLTESRYPGSAVMKRIAATLERCRGYSAWETVARALLMGGYRFGALDLTRAALAPGSPAVLVVGSARYMEARVQEKLAAYVRDGGAMLLWGEVPTDDLEERPCTVLAAELGARVTRYHENDPWVNLSVVPEGWIGGRPEVRVPDAQCYDAPGAAPLLRVAHTGELAGFDARVGAGRAVVLGAGYDCDVELFRGILSELGASPALAHDDPRWGVILTTTRNGAGERVLHVLNLDGFHRDLALTERGSPLLGGERVWIGSRRGLMLPLDFRLGDVVLRWSTAEPSGLGEGWLGLRCARAGEAVALEGARVVRSSAYTVERRAGLCVVRTRVAGDVTVRWKRG